MIDGACECCGCTRFQIVTETAREHRGLSFKEAIRQDLHTWIDLNIDSMTNEQLTELRVQIMFPQNNQRNGVSPPSPAN